MACRTGCPTQDCEDYAACCRGVAINKTSLRVN
jgi:hypothetical protein